MSSGQAHQSSGRKASPHEVFGDFDCGKLVQKNQRMQGLRAKEALLVLQKHYKDTTHMPEKPRFVVLESQLISVGRLCPPSLAEILQPHVPMLGVVYMGTPCRNLGTSTLRHSAMPLSCHPSALPGQTPDFTVLAPNQPFLFFTFTPYQCIVPVERPSLANVGYDGCSDQEAIALSPVASEKSTKAADMVEESPDVEESSLITETSQTQPSKAHRPIVRRHSA